MTERLSGIEEAYTDGYDRGYQAALNKLSELSIKINKLQSDLREFEKERVNPKFEEVRREIELLKESK